MSSLGSKSLPTRSDRGDGEVTGGDNGDTVIIISGGRDSRKRAARFDRCFSGLELRIGPGPGPLKDVDAGRLKGQIRRWAKAVVAYARQLSFGSPRTSRSASTPTPTPTPTPKSGLGAAGEEEPPPPT